MTVVLIVLCVLLGACVAAVVFYVGALKGCRKMLSESEMRGSDLSAVLDRERVRAHDAEQSAADADRRAAEANQRAAVAETRVEEQKNYYEAQLADKERQHEQRVNEVRQTMEDKFKTLAAETLESTVQRHSKQAGQSLETILAPMRSAFEKLSLEFERRSLDTKAERTVLQEGINALRQLNLQVSDETRRLTHALKGNTGFQGRWGEMVLENILEGSGLEPSRWVVYQESTTTETGGRLRPDAVIHCPRGREIIIDSKVSLKSYLCMTEAENEDDRKTYAEEHLRSLEQHLRSLSSKEYQTHIGAGKAGFVLMFVPHEGAYMAAMQANPDLWQKAYERHVVIVSPTHLVTVIRLVEQMWQTEDQTAHSIAIAEEATKMLDQLNDFLNDLVSVETAIDKARDAAAKAHKRLATGNGNVLRRAERLQSLGIKTKKTLRLNSEDAGE